MDQAPDTASIRKKLETIAERDNVPIIRAAERDLLLEAAEPVMPGRILEIGTAIGYSALLLAERFPSSEIDTIEVDPERHEIAVSAMKEAGMEDRVHCHLGDARVHCHLGDAADILKTLSGTYDFLYLDGPKGQYLRELMEIEPKLSPRAVICADNVLFRGLVRSSEPVAHRYRTLVMRLREYISYVEEKYNTVIYEEGDGLAVSSPKDIKR